MAVSSKKVKKNKENRVLCDDGCIFMYHVVPICDYVNDFI